MFQMGKRRASAFKPPLMLLPLVLLLLFPPEDIFDSMAAAFDSVADTWLLLLLTILLLDPLEAGPEVRDDEDDDPVAMEETTAGVREGSGRCCRSVGRRDPPAGDCVDDVAKNDSPTIMFMLLDPRPVVVWETGCL